jgi:predicted  nucleic acid-binding Zn-ribbon protein
MPSGFSVIALISAYNEADIIEHVVTDLINQGVKVYFMDDGSTDGTLAVVERHLGNGVIGFERLGQPDRDSAPATFNWDRILLRKTELANELEASWFIHHDADEFRESPWPHLSLRDAIRHVDALGFNAIDFSGLDFWPVHDRFRAGDDVRDTLTGYTELAPYDRVQVRCWKKTSAVDLASSGGHEARFPGRRIFPLRFILRHYPIRGQTHGERKVFQERRNRFRDEERARGWHVQYDQLQEGASFLRDPSTLTAYDAEGVRLSLTLHPRYPEELEQALGAARSEATTAQCALAAARAEVAAMHREIEAASAHIEQVTAQLVQARDEVRARDALQREIEAASAHIDDVTAQLVEARSVRDVMHREIEAASAHIEQVTGQLVEARGVRDAMQREIEAASAHIEQVTAQLLQAREQLRASDALHRETETASNHLRDAMHLEIERASTHIEHVTAQLIQARDTLRARDTEAAARDVRIAALVEALDQRAAEIDRWRTTADDLTHKLEAFQGSLSWRWTAPIRAIVRMLRRS